MMRLSHIAAPAALSLSLLIGVSGCMHDRHEEIPSTAMMAAEGDERLAFTAQEEGKVFVYDVNADRMIYSGNLKDGDEVVLDPEHNTLMVDGRTALEDGIRRGNRHQIFFNQAKPDVTRESKVIVEETKVKRSSD
jgi:hypothetical protein